MFSGPTEPCAMERPCAYDERAGDAASDLDHPVRRHRAGLQQPSQGLPLEQLHDDEVPLAVLPPVEHLDDTRVLQPGLELSGGPELLQERGVRALGGGEQLDCHASVELLIERAPDLRSSAEVQTVVEQVSSGDQ